MATQPRGTRWSRLDNADTQGLRKANSRVPMTGEERAAAFLAHARQARSNKIVGGSADTASKGQERRFKLMQFRNVAPVAKSVAHRGVVERPMDQGLSKMLDERRAEMKGRGTSVARVNRYGELEAQADAASPDTAGETSMNDWESPHPEDRVLDELQEANSSQETEQGGTSIGRMRSAKKEMRLKDAISRKPPSLGDMEI